MTASNVRPGSSTPHDLPYPIHRLNQPQMILWLMSDTVRREMTSALVQKREYRGGVGLISPTLYLFALVDPRGNYRDLQPPFRTFEMWQISNQPETPACQCADYLDIESGGKWKDSGKEGHHPMCQFERVSGKVFSAAAERAWTRIGEGLDPQDRPDEWDRLRQEARER